jgi:hypothetical protein
MDPELVIQILQAIITNLPTEIAAVQGVVKFAEDMIAAIRSGQPVTQSDIDALISQIEANSAIIQSKA